MMYYRTVSPSVDSDLVCVLLNSAGRGTRGNRLECYSNQ